MASVTNVLKVMLRNRIAVFQNLTEIYLPAITREREKLIELIKEKAETAAKSELAKKLRVAKGFYTLEMAPPAGDAEMKKLMSDLALLKDFFQKGCYKHVTIRQAWLMILIGTEVGLWFYLGETIGKMHVVGYSV